MSLRRLTDREKRTIRIAGIGTAIYLALFGGYQVWTFLATQRSDYLKLVREAEAIKAELQVYQLKTQTLKKLMESFQLDPAKLNKISTVAEASAAIQRAAMGGGVGLGSIRESPARPSSRELGSIQMEAMGQVPMLMAMMHRLQTLGYPLIVDAVQVTADGKQPGMVKLSLTIVVLDFEQWKATPNA
jgi:hypothetical protein